MLTLDEGNLIVKKQQYRSRREANDVRVNDDMISGTTRRCKACAGSGILGIGSGSAKQCPICNGMGEISSFETFVAPRSL